MPVNIELNKDEYIELYFDLGKSIEHHKQKKDQYKKMKLEQGVSYESDRISVLESIRKKLEGVFKE